MPQTSLKLTIEEIPIRFQHLFHYAERFGHPEYIDRVCSISVTDEELLRFWAAVEPYRDEINEWILSFPKDRSWTDGESAFLYMLQALDYAEPESHETQERKQQFWDSTIYPNQIKKACEIAEQEFSNKNYSGVISLLKPYERDLPKVAKAKMLFAQNKILNNS